MLRCGEAAIDEVLVKCRDGRHHYHDLSDVCCNQFLAHVVRAVEQRVASSPLLYHALARPPSCNTDVIAARERAAPASRHAIERRAVPQLDQVTAAVGGDDLSFEQSAAARLPAFSHQSAKGVNTRSPHPAGAAVRPVKGREIIVGLPLTLERKELVELGRTDEVVFRETVDRMRNVLDAALVKAYADVGMMVFPM